MHSKHHHRRHTEVHEKPVSPASLSPPPPYSPNAGPSGLHVKHIVPPQHTSSFAPSPYDLPSLTFPEDNPKGWKAQMKNLAPGKSPAKLLEPPPPSFTRPPPPTLSYEDFPDIELIGNGTMLDQGFPYLAPFCPTAPHPFITHDVTEHDWRQFLHDIRIAGSLSPTNRIVSGVLPMAFGFGLILGASRCATADIAGMS
ncbi:hypothetical protein TRAPUB_816 [Trametes pubescens]|uniref:Uncharacterized protein n=1 Tax=Trametes pubescens TaxID=154538 RepID=A0A1M2VL30_TRAPU|nr:hypothetical protein TRAPUB_816 [Trametes pubescens]